MPVSTILFTVLQVYQSHCDRTNYNIGGTRTFWRGISRGELLTHPHSVDIKVSCELEGRTILVLSLPNISSPIFQQVAKCVEYGIPALLIILLFSQVIYFCLQTVLANFGMTSKGVLYAYLCSNFCSFHPVLEAHSSPWTSLLRAVPHHLWGDYYMDLCNHPHCRGRLQPCKCAWTEELQDWSSRPSVRCTLVCSQACPCSRLLTEQEIWIIMTCILRPHLFLTTSFFILPGWGYHTHSNGVALRLTSVTFSVLWLLLLHLW